MIYDKYRATTAESNIGACVRLSDAVAFVFPPKFKSNVFIVCWQIVLMISQTMWCRDITECLTSDGDRLEGMKVQEKKSFEVCVFALQREGKKG